MISIMKPPVIQQIIASGRKSLFEYEAKAFCESFGIPTTKFEIAYASNIIIRPITALTIVSFAFPIFCSFP